ncbi:MAG: DUF2807 domain-containing protein [Bacteroidetes bacterium]|nr:DUF2807 domain-containing protein [Bacteroidota bacterium]
MKPIKLLVILGVIGSILTAGLLCGQQLAITGSGNLEMQKREVGSFCGVSSSSGINVTLKNGKENMVSVTADDNILNLIITEVKDNRLIIKYKNNVNMKQSKACEVIVVMKEVCDLSASSGSKIKSTDTFSGNKIELNTSSGASIKVGLNANEISCSSSSGSAITLTGTADKMTANVSSNGEIKAGSMTISDVEAEASSGGEIDVNVNRSIVARASSGGEITYSGNPQTVDKKSSSGGQIKAAVN